MDLSVIRQQLEQQRNELLRRVSKLDKDLHHRDEAYSQDFAEQAVELENLEVLFELDREGRETLKQINEALYRLDNDCYHLCGSCGELIGTARLLALPFTELCIDCANQSKQG